MNVRQTARYLLDRKELNNERPIQTSGHISYANWWTVNPGDYWFTRFTLHYFPDLKKNIRFYSVFGPRSRLREDFDGIKIFFSGENLEPPIKHNRLSIRKVSERLSEYRRRQYGDYGLSDVQISMGFTERIAGKPYSAGNGGTVKNSQQAGYFRFPLWITYLIEPEDDYNDILRRIHIINQTHNPDMAHGVTCIASHDFFGTRTDICDGLERAGIPIAYAGNWRNNTQALKQDFGDDKQRYLHLVRFIVCPENMDADGYVTEKLFDAFAAGAIPIYQGSGGFSEQGLINPDVVLFWDYDGDNEKVVSKIKELEQSDAEYLDFMNQVKLTDSCADYVWDRIKLLRKYLEEAINLRNT